MGVVVKRPIANAAWKTGQKPESSYHHTYWNRLQQLSYDFLQDELNKSFEMALRFTLTVPGVHTAIVGTTNPDRWLENAKLLEQGNLSETAFQAIRTRWREIAKDDWIGQG